MEKQDPQDRQEQPQSTEEWEGWSIHSFGCVSSTNELAKDYQDWDVVVAAEQTKGRGRQGRKWVSDQGGLWMSMVLPWKDVSEKGMTLSLVVGYGIVLELREMGVENARLRWPNDILIGESKVAGILLERFSDERVIGGVGINVMTCPKGEQLDREQKTACLADFLKGEILQQTLFKRILTRIKQLHEVVSKEGFEAIQPALNLNWGREENGKKVKLLVGEKWEEGRFRGVDVSGNVLLQREANADKWDTIRAGHISELREI